MDTMEYQNGRYGVNTVMLSTLAGFAMKTLKAKYSVTLMHLQNGESSAGIFDFVNNDEGSYFEGYQHNLFYSQSHYPIFILQPNTNLKKQNGI